MAGRVRAELARRPAGERREIEGGSAVAIGDDGDLVAPRGGQHGAFVARGRARERARRAPAGRDREDVARSAGRRASQEEDLAPIARVDGLRVEPARVLGERLRRAARVDPPQARAASGRSRGAARRASRRPARSSAAGRSRSIPPPRSPAGSRSPGRRARSRRVACRRGTRRRSPAAWATTRATARRAAGCARAWSQLPGPDPRASGRACRHAVDARKARRPAGADQNGQVSSIPGVAVIG